MLTKIELEKHLIYDPTTGNFYRYKPNKIILVGDMAGTKDKDGYIVISVLGQTYKANRLAWLYMTGNWPLDKIDHKDTIRDNNKWDNLRESTNNNNQHNRRINSKHKTGVKGLRYVEASFGKNAYYAAQVKAFGVRYTKRINVIPGRSEEDIVEDLYLWLVETRDKLHGEFANNG